MPADPIQRANAWVNARKEAFGASFETSAHFPSDRSAILRQFVSGTAINPDSLDRYARAAAVAGVVNIINDGQAVGLDVVLDGLVLDAFLHGYQARRFEEEAAP